MNACECGNVEKVQELLDQGVDPRVDNNYGFRWACYYGYTDIVKLLLSLDESRGVDLSVCDNFGVRWACEKGRIEVVKLLLSLDPSRRVDPSACDNYGFRWACEKGRIEVVKLLLSLDESRGIDPSARDNYGFMNFNFSDDKDLFLSFIHHPKFYASNTTSATSGVLPERVQKKVEVFWNRKR